MGTVQFEIDQIKPLIEHAKAAKEHRKTYGEDNAVPSLHFVHDHGVYLMSNGIPHMPHPHKPQSSFVVYAKDCDPDKDPDCWDNASSLVGGDDFVESLPVSDIEPLIEAAARRKFRHFYVQLTQTQLKMGVRR